MKISDLNGKTVCVLGYGREGRAMADAILKYAPKSRITICDQNGALRIENEELRTQLGEGWLEGITDFDVIIKSPGIPPSAIPQLSTLNSQLASSTQIFLDTIADRGAVTIGVTGSKGKSTTSSLIYAILKEAKKDVILTGNIGEPSIAHLDDVKKGTIVVMEMSSYQLMDLTVSPHIAVITSFFPEHLDYHGSLEAYLEAKKHITKFQGQDDVVFFNATSPDTAEIAKEGDGTKIPFTPEDCPVDMSETRLIGEHNSTNIAAANMVTSMLGIPSKITLQAIKGFKGLPHRLQSLGIHHEREWIDDAISTTPQSAIAALDALGDRVAVMILGGQDRGYDFTPLAERIKDSSIELILLFPGSGPKIREALVKAKVETEMIDVNSMEQAVQEAKSYSLKAKNSIVLLSTASPSYGMFKNFEEKGEIFEQCIKDL